MRELEVYIGQGNRLLEEDQSVTQEHFIMNTVDGSFESDPFYCFVSEHPSDGWALYVVPWSLVTHVKVLSVAGVGSEYTSDSERQEP